MESNKTNFSSSSYVSQNTDTPFNNTNAHSISRYEGKAQGQDIILTDMLINVYLIDGQALGPEYFGFTDPLSQILGDLKNTLEHLEQMVFYLPL